MIVLCSLTYAKLYKTFEGILRLHAPIRGQLLRVLAPKNVIANNHAVLHHLPLNSDSANTKGRNLDGTAHRSAVQRYGLAFKFEVGFNIN